MCEYCKYDYSAKPIVKDRTTEISIETADSELYIDYDSGGYEASYFRHYLKINYCPMCGRKLKEETL